MRHSHINKRTVDGSVNIRPSAPHLGVTPWPDMRFIRIWELHTNSITHTVSSNDFFTPSSNTFPDLFFTWHIRHLCVSVLPNCITLQSSITRLFMDTFTLSHHIMPLYASLFIFFFVFLFCCCFFLFFTNTIFISKDIISINENNSSFWEH